MMKTSTPVTLIKMIITVLFTGLMSISAIAQKLPNVQQGGFRAPIAVKIDGKSTEWGVNFQAHNSATGVFYTLANDNNNLPGYANK